ncbi:gem-associated protein 2-like [Pseudomyrmex gracilis]|uniref:gem-associated protein 2-like n=1 Tax=Pseudomyrmex gracilis TaxID=219809 RepID=UPI000995A1C0|nr:gem-associated protein 2-like [Pseudomyrmex gracilis]XP_020297480.1 gem-associated protein 2-like [Pseudomyrmex gracilis]XP_020297487.1 gem-associated protein 2-like [Pseudomyrmex gracilis]
MMDLGKQQVFEVGNIDEKIDLSLPPTSGEEYIKRVVIEAQSCADTVVADLDTSIIKKIPISYCKLLPGCVEAPSGLSPTLEWQQLQVSNFSDVRLYVSQLKNEVKTNKRKWTASSIKLPDIKDQQGWIKFCNGGVVDPTLDIVFCFTQALAEQLLEYLTEWVETERILSYHIGQWIYALLVILEEPLFPDTCFTLRSLARVCSALRAEQRLPFTYDSDLRALNLFICLVARYFRQLDLADH